MDSKTIITSWFHQITKRKKPKETSYEKLEENTWDAKEFEKSVSEGVRAFASGTPVRVSNYGNRGFELILRIKQDYILLRQRELAEMLEISDVSEGYILKMQNKL